MPISIHASGTRTAGTPPEANFTVLGTTGDTTSGVYQIFIDTANLANGDEVEIQVLEKVLSTSTQRVVFSAVISNAQDEPVWVSPSLILFQSWQVQIKQLLGTARSFDWSIRKIT